YVRVFRPGQSGVTRVRSFFRCPFQHAGVALTTDDKLSIETLRLVFPNACGLKYRANGGYNYISYIFDDDGFAKPLGGWGDNDYEVLVEPPIFVPRAPAGFAAENAPKCIFGKYKYYTDKTRLLSLLL
uniref:TAR DNA-binding protein 43 N-terminal domain-containing protein n=1 Tax=Meloidogyne javanica TaxID=6303 RepID=A0A915N6C4_MELJA